MKHARPRAALVAAGLLLAFGPDPTTALTFSSVEVACPVDGHRFKSTQMASGTSFCMRLDLRRVGAIASPPPLHACPNDGYVWHDEDLEDGELDAVRGWVRTDEFQTLRAESDYFRLAKIYERAGRGDRAIGFAYLRASWEVESDPARHERYLALAAERLVRALEGPKEANESDADRLAQRVLAGELERRLGRFAEAHTRFDAVQRERGGAQEVVDRVIAYELALIARSDRAPHYVPQDDGTQGDCERYSPKAAAHP